MTISRSETPMPIGSPTVAPLPSVISAAEMDELVRNGRADQWELPIEGNTPLVTLVDGVWVETEDGWTLQSGQWYSVFVDREDGAYERAPDDAALVFTDFYARLMTADQAVALKSDVDAETVHDVDSDGQPVVLQPPPDDPSPR